MHSPPPVPRRPSWPGAGQYGDPIVSANAEKVPKAAVDEFTATFDEHVDLVYRFLRSMGLSEHQAEDAVQDVFLIVHQKLSSFEGRSKMSTWICGIARNVAMNHRRRANRQGAHHEFDETRVPGGPSPEDQFQGSESVQKIQAFASRLEGGMREVFSLCFLEEMRAPDVAEILGVPLPTVYSRIRLLRVALSDVLSSEKEVLHER